MEIAAVNSNGSNEESFEGTNSTIISFSREKLERAKASFEDREWERHCIYRVPSILKATPMDDKCYKAHCRPRVVSIGPYHYGDAHLEAMQFHKYRLLHFLLSKAGKHLDDALKVIKNVEPQARACYQDLPESSFPGDTFVEMLLLDACFVLDTLYDFWKKEVGDYVICKSFIDFSIGCDMILLENQIPIFIVNHMYEFLFDTPHNNKVLDSMFYLYEPSWVIGRDLRSEDGNGLVLSSSKLENGGIGTNGVQSGLELFWHGLMYDSTAQEYYKTKMTKEDEEEEKYLVDLEKHAIPGVTAMKETGVVFKHKISVPFWDIEFEETGILKIPQIKVDETTESIFLNLMAFELCHLDEEKHRVMPYILFMDKLIDTASDVAELGAQSIIIHVGGSSDELVADLFNRLAKKAFGRMNQFQDLSRKINKYCHRRRNRWRANLMHNYFNSPWAAISVIAAALLLLLTIMQTWYSAGQYYQNPNGNSTHV